MLKPFLLQPFPKQLSLPLLFLLLHFLLRVEPPSPLLLSQQLLFPPPLSRLPLFPLPLWPPFPWLLSRLPPFPQQRSLLQLFLRVGHETFPSLIALKM